QLKLVTQNVALELEKNEKALGLEKIGQYRQWDVPKNIRDAVANPSDLTYKISPQADGSYIIYKRKFDPTTTDTTEDFTVKNVVGWDDKKKEPIWSEPTTIKAGQAKMNVMEAELDKQRKQNTDARMQHLTAAHLAAETGLAGAQTEQARAEAKKALSEASLGGAIDTVRNNTTTGKTGEAALEGVDPMLAGVVRGLTDYTLTEKEVAQYRGNQRLQLAELAKAYDPYFDMTQYAVRLKLRQAFTSGKPADAIKSLNQATHHIDNLVSSANSLRNTPIQAWNYIANAFREGTGDPRVDRVLTDATAVEGEMANVFKNSGATDQEIHAWRERLTTSKSPQQFGATFDELFTLMAGRMDALNSQYVEGMQKPRNFRLLSEDSQRILNKIGGRAADLANYDLSGYRPKGERQAGQSANQGQPQANRPTFTGQLPMG